MCACACARASVCVCVCEGLRDGVGSQLSARSTVTAKWLRGRMRVRTVGEKKLNRKEVSLTSAGC